MSRDKADTLLLLLACGLVLLPQAPHAPLWVILCCAALLLWRGWITFRGNRLPPRSLLLPIAALAMVAVYATHKTLLGREAGVSMLVLLLALKLLEMHARRDVFVVSFLGFFLMLANFFNSQSIGAALMTLIAMATMLTAQLSFQYTGMVPPLWQRLKLGLFIVALAVPLTALLFILFPRIEGPLWGLPSDANSGRTGLSDTMAPGNIAHLAQSDDVAFRAKFFASPPAKSSLYWRGILLDQYDGRTWTHKPSIVQTRPAATQMHGNPTRYQVTLEPHGKRWLFALDLPQAAPLLANNAASIDADYQMIATRPIDTRVRYDVASYIDFDLRSPRPSPARQTWLQLPAGFNPRTLDFAAQLHRQMPNQLQLIQAVLRHFREEPFRYTLEAPPLGRDSVDDFLFGTRAGFCEHYASAFVVLMRAAGIPARVVTGYQGGEINPVDGFMTVRQSDAHAWAEVWLADRGWIRVDPTAAVAPSRIENNLARAIPSSPLGGLFHLNTASASWLNALRFNWDAVTNAWNQWVLNYSADKQKSLLQSLGFDHADWRTLIILLISIGSVVMLAITWPLVRHRQKIDPVHALYMRFCQLMARHGVARAPHEGPRDYRIRITQAEAGLSPQKKIAAARFLAYYEAVQYGTVCASATATKPTPLSQLKFLLSQCR